MRKTTNIFGYNFICEATYAGLADEIISTAWDGSMGITNFITPNAHGINMYGKHPDLNSFCKGSKYILPDGQPIVWLSYLTDNPIKERLTGSDFFPVIYSRVKSESPNQCLFVVSNESVKARFMAEKKDAIYYIPVFFELHEADKIDRIGSDLCELIIRNRLKLIFIGISEPKQGALAQNVTVKLKAAGYQGSCLFLFLGASYEFYFGIKKRAPQFFRKTGLEWCYRLFSEPRRMFKRYIFGNIIFVIKAIKWFSTYKKSGKQ